MTDGSTEATPANSATPAKPRKQIIMPSIRINPCLCAITLMSLLSLAVPPQAGAAPSQQMEDENLLHTLPDGYVMANQQRKGDIAITEMIPKGETLDNWSEILTSQIFFNGADLPIDRYKAFIAKQFHDGCDTSETVPIADGVENGYKFAFWLQTCHYDDAAKKPEITWIKMINGNDASYVVQEAFHREPSKEEVVKWSKFFRTVSVCDSRLPDRPCLRTK